MKARQTFRVIVLTPPGLVDPSLAIAASRAGGAGLLDLEYVQDEQAGQEAVRRLSRNAGPRYGVKLGSRDTDLLVALSSGLPDSLGVVILTSSDPAQLPDQLRRLRKEGRVILLECTSLAQARAAEQCGFDGIIAKGNEAGGRVGDETTFILLQRFLRQVSLPVWAQGGVGIHTAAACYAAGAAGIVLDSQLYLARESPLPEPVRSKIAVMDGSEMFCLGQDLGECYRVYARPGAPAVARLREEERQLGESGCPQSEVSARWREAFRHHIGWTEQHLWLLGQDAAFASPLAKRFGSVAGILQGIRAAARSHWQMASALRPLDEGAPLAVSHATRYPIVQGPMTRVSDTPAFAEAVLDGGGLPFLALALMRGPEVKCLLEETERRLRNRPWGVGILGFVPLEFREEQIEAIRACRPPFALIAGARPDQAGSLERDGIATYVHVPSPGLLELFLTHGAKRFVFEGRECGGHVGPRSSFVLWERMVEILLGSLPADRARAEAYHVLFAGGIHDALSASMVAVLAAPLAERGVRIGVLMGTAYLFTKEAVASGAIVRGFQEEAIRCDRTALLETGPGHATRCAESHYVQGFLRARRRLIEEGKSADEIRLALEALNLGRLRIATKGITRLDHDGDGSPSPLTTLNEEAQQSQGMYMIGQAAALRSGVTTIAELHHEVSVKGSARLDLPLETRREADGIPGPSIAATASRPSDVAIIGMSCILPKAPCLRAYWQNILNKVNALIEIPADRWDWREYYDRDPRAKDKVYSKWGGFIDEIPFDPLSYGMPPGSLSSIDPIQLLTLEAVRAALRDAGYLDRPFDRERASVILGASGAGELGQLYGFRSWIPHLFGAEGPQILARLDSNLPQWTEDSFPGILTNIVAGRVANRFDLGGVNFTVDAACASSLAAVQLAVEELERRTSDMVIVGGADTIQSPFAYLCFSKTYALSPSGRCRPFDEKADGIAISEGIGILVLKRLADAERDGDRIYAVIKGIGGSSDGRDKGLTAPRPEGQILALRRAYVKAGISPATVGLIEAHGTGTVVGDRAELDALHEAFKDAPLAPQSCAVGSVKSMIGHTKKTAGAASLIKVALALHHKVLPPTIGVETPIARARIPESGFYVNTEPRPWIHGTAEHPRRAGVSAFGFGGTNFHAVLEEYPVDLPGDFAKRPPLLRPGELFIWRADSRRGLVDAVGSLQQALSQGARPSLPDLAFTLLRTGGEGPRKLTLAVVATSLEDLQAKLVLARQSLADSTTVRVTDPRGIYFSEQPLAREGKLAFLFPGQGSHYPNMLLDLAMNFPEVRTVFERADFILREKLPRPLSAYIFPPPAFSREEEQAQQEALTQTCIAQPAVAAADLALRHLLGRLGIHPDFVAGHSFGEYPALCAAGVFGEEELFALSEARGRFMAEGVGDEPGGMAAVRAGASDVVEALAGLQGVFLANHNAPTQTVIAGTGPALQTAVERLRAGGMDVRHLPVACAFHSPLMAPAREKLAGFLSSVELRPPRIAVFSNTTTAPHAPEPRAIVAQLAEHMVGPVRFVEEVEALYAAGARLFVEVGPRTVLSGLTDQILGERPHLAVATDQPGRPGILQLLHALGRLAVEGVRVRFDRFFEETPVSLLDLSNLPRADGQGARKGIWLVNGGRARPAEEPTGTVLGKEEQPTARSALPATEPSRPGTDSSLGLTQVATPEELTTWTGTSPPRPPGPTSARADHISEVMRQYHQTMQRFLDTQRSVMLAYLRGQSGSPGPAIEAGVPGLPERSPDAPQMQQPPARTTPALPVPSVQPGSAQRSVGRPANDGSSPTDPGMPLEVFRPLTEAQLTSRLLQLVSERTGYPPEMLDLDLDMEADLGIDSIKRVEILGNYQRLHASSATAIREEDMEKLMSLRTLRSVIGWLMAGIRPPGPKQLPETVGGGELAIGGAPLRYTLAADERPVHDQGPRLPIAGVVVLTDDRTGIAQALAGQLTERGLGVALVQTRDVAGETAPGRYAADLTSVEGVAELCALIRQKQGPIGGLVHLLPLRSCEAHSGMDLAAWRGRLREEVKGLYHLARGLHEDLKTASQRGGACLLAATGMGGAFATDQLETADFFPGQGGVAGLAKTLAHEWPGVRVKVVDLNPREPIPHIVGHLCRELLTRDGIVEVGCRGDRRLILRPRATSVKREDPHLCSIDRSWVILVTGGARGITAEVTRHLAELYRPTLVLVGRSPVPPPTELPETAGLVSARELKAAFMDRMGHEGRPVAPARVEAEYLRITRERGIRRNLAAMEATGARVHYFSADVRDEAVFGSVIEQIYRTHGRIDGVIHGAGVIEDKLIQDKLPESFDRVFDTKVDGAFILSRNLRPEDLKFLAFFTSMAGRFGNRGQADYAAANEVLNKLARQLDGRWPGRVVSVNWGPWGNVGMVTPELEREFSRRGIALISPPEGCRRLEQEICWGRKGEVEILYLLGGGGGVPDSGDGRELGYTESLASTPEGLGA